MYETTSRMSQKGQLVVPQDIRDKGNFQPGDRFISLSLPDGILFKKVKNQDYSREFEKLSEELKKHFMKNGFSKKDLEDAIQWAKKEPLSTPTSLSRLLGGEKLQK